MQSNDPVMQQQHSIFTGESLGSAVRRQKLQQRNAILRRTGFLEGPARVKGVAGNTGTCVHCCMHYQQAACEVSWAALTAVL